MTTKKQRAKTAPKPEDKPGPNPGPTAQDVSRAFTDGWKGEFIIQWPAAEVLAELIERELEDKGKCTSRSTVIRTEWLQSGLRQAFMVAAGGGE